LIEFTITHHVDWDESSWAPFGVAASILKKKSGGVWEASYLAWRGEAPCDPALKIACKIT
jgi:hypothetical protein